MFFHTFIVTDIRDMAIWNPLCTCKVGADKFLARPARKQLTANKLGIYSTYSPRSSIHFLAICSNLCKPLKKIQNIFRPTRSARQYWFPLRTKNGEPSITFSVQRTGGSPTGPDLENRVGDQDIGSPGRPVSYALQVPGERVHYPARTRHTWWTSRGIFPSKRPSITLAEMSNTPCWYFGPLEDNQWTESRLNPTKSRREFLQ
jgi:hypothetical protein